MTWLDELFGVEHRLRYGLIDPIDGDSVTFELVAPLGDLEAGKRLTFAVAGEPGARSYLPVEPAGAEVVAVDGEGRPALLRHRLGSGQTILCTYPIEHMAARTPRVNPEATSRLYAALAESAGVVRPVVVSDPRVVAGTIRHGAARTAVLVNCTSEPVVAEPVLSTEAGAPRALAPVVLPPLGAAVIPRVDDAPSDLQPATASHEGSDALGAR